MDRIYEGSLLYGRQLPDYTGSSATSVKLFIPRGLPDENFVRMLSEEQQRTGVPLSLSSLLILNALKWGRRMSVGDIQQATHLLESKVRAAAERMVEAGLLETSGNGRNRAYIISSHMYQNKINYVRQTGIEKLRYDESVLKLAEQQPFVTRKDVVELLHVTPPQAYRILQKMTNEGKLTPLGTTRDRRYQKASV